MHRPERILIALLGGALAALALWKAPPWSGARARAAAPAAAERTDARGAPPAAPGPARSRAEDQRAFLALLQRFRAGEESALAALREAARVMAEAHASAGSPAAVEYYAALEPGARTVGLRDEGRFRELWARVRAAPHEEGAWAAERRLVLDELRDLIARALARPDFAPAWRALSLCARIEVEQLEKSPSLPPDEREELLAQAEQDARRALAVFERAGFETPRLEPEWILGRLAYLRSAPGEAAERFERVRAGADRAQIAAFHEHALYGLLGLAKDAADLRRIDALLAELAALEDPRESWPLAREQAWRMVQDDDAPGAIEFLLRNRPEAAEELERWHALLARAQLRNGELEAARAQLERLDPRRSSADVLLIGAQLDLQRGRPERALLALEAPGALAALAPTARAFALVLLGEALLDLERPAEALRELERAMDLAEEWETRLAAERGLRAGGSYVAGEQLGLHAVALAGQALARLGDALGAAALVEAWQARGLRRAKGAAEVGPGDVAAWAAGYELGLLACVSGADSALVVHVAPDGGAEARRVPRGRRELQRAVRRLRETAVADDEPRARALGGELADALLPDGLRARLLAAAPDERLLLSLHGPLERLPESLLFVDGRALDELAATSVLAGLPARRPPAPPQDGAFARWHLLGDPIVFDRLPGAAAELEELERLRPGAEIDAGSRFVAGAVEAALRSGRCLHVATHVVDAPECRRGGLRTLALELSGGELLCAEELRALRPRAPLVVLSACATAGGRAVDAEGLLGLARAFVEAGTRDLLVTLWPVEDGAARDFALAYHRALLEGLAPSRAARAARRELAAAGHGLAERAAFRAMGVD